MTVLVGTIFVLTFAWLGLCAAAVAQPAGACSAGPPRYDIALPGHPFSVLQTADGKYAFVTLVSSGPRSSSGVAVLTCTGGRYRFSHLERVQPSPLGAALTHDGKLLIAGDDGYVVFFDTAALIAKRPALLGYIQDAPGDPEDNDAGSINAAVTPDDRYAMISDESNDDITVVDLAKVRAGRFAGGVTVGTIPTGNAPIAIKFSADGRYALTTSEAADGFGWPKQCRPEGSPPSTPPRHTAGAIIVVDVAKAQQSPHDAVVSKIPADCAPVRMDLSPDRSIAWVTNRSSGTVVAFNVAKLIAGDPSARIATVAVGSNPVAVAVTSDGKYVLAANTNRFGSGGTAATSTISVIDASSRTVVGTMAAGSFPREFTHGNGSTLFLANYRSNTVTVFDTAQLRAIVQRP